MGVLTEREGVRRFELLPRTLVGRSPSCDLVIDDDPGVSAEHLVVSFHDEAWRVRDLGSRNGTWVAGRSVSPGDTVRLAEGDEVRLGPRCTFVLSEASPPADARPAGLPSTRAERIGLHEVQIAFAVSSDEESAAWSVTVGGRRVSLGDRVHTYLLLTLARQRAEDAANGITEANRGWCYADDLARRLGITPEVLKVYVYRARRQLEGAGVVGAAGIVERRLATNQIRFGVDGAVVRRDA